MATFVSVITAFSGSSKRKLLVLFLVFSSLSVGAQDSLVRNLKVLTLEQLMNLEVTSVAKVAQRLNEVPSAIQVITHDDILRSGATSIPEALRLAPNLQVAQLNSSAWIIGARGFNTVFANKLLVLIDGRTVYTPLFGGVLWDLQSVLLEDVDRIEVISGPGATLWGANAVNGVINIITRKAKDTQGVYASVSGGNFMKRAVAVRYGNKIGEKIFYRIYGQTTDRDSTKGNAGDNSDAWRSSQAGFRAGFYPDEKNNFILQGDVYTGTKNTAPKKSPFDGQNLLGRWTRNFSDKSELIVQTYFDRYWRDDPGTADQLETYDFDLQHRFPVGDKQSVLWGAGYRYVHDNVINRSSFAGLIPAARSLPLYSGFIQDQIAIAPKLKLTIGTKLLHNVYSGFEIQPSARIAWNVERNSTIWAAVSRAIRAPSRFDVDYRLPLQPQPPVGPNVTGSSAFDSEKLHAFELGFRSQPNRKLSLSIAGFYNQYKDLYSVEPVPNTQTYLIQNGSVAESWGGELSGFFQPFKTWRIRGGFTYFAKDLRPKPGHNHDPSYLGNDARHHVVLQSLLNLPGNFRFDLVGRYLDYIPQSFATARIPEYCELDARIAWSLKSLELSVTGQNLLQKYHPEFETQQIPRSLYGRIACRF